MHGFIEKYQTQYALEGTTTAANVENLYLGMKESQKKNRKKKKKKDETITFKKLMHMTVSTSHTPPLITLGWFNNLYKYMHTALALLILWNYQPPEVPGRIAKILE